jgi:hypothetical protein
VVGTEDVVRDKIGLKLIPMMVFMEMIVKALLLDELFFERFNCRCNVCHSRELK